MLCIILAGLPCNLTVIFGVVNMWRGTQHFTPIYLIKVNAGTILVLFISIWMYGGPEAVIGPGCDIISIVLFSAHWLGFR